MESAPGVLVLWILDVTVRAVRLLVGTDGTDPDGPGPDTAGPDTAGPDTAG